MATRRAGSGTTCSPSSVDPGAHAVRFLNNLTHTGDYSGEPFALRPWQSEPIRRLFGTLRRDGTRQYRKTFWALPRKQGKTELVAGSSLYLLMGQGRTDRRIYTASGDTKQAALIFGAARDMIRNDPELEARTIIYEGYKRIEFPAARSQLEVLSAAPKSKHGLGPTDVLVDEFHVVKEELVNVLTTGFGARKDPLTWMITTAGHERHSLCYDEWQYAIKVRDGIITDPTYLPVIYAAEPSDDWHSEATWFKAMPALGDFCNLDFIREEYRKALERPRFQNTFRQLYLNQWTEQAERWLSLDLWDACSGLDLAELDGRECYAGLDLGVTGDMSALALGFPNDLGGLDVHCLFWSPREGKWTHEPRNAGAYRQWAAQGHLTLTDGKATDYDQVEREIVKVNERWPIRSLFGDRAYAGQMLKNLFSKHELPTMAIPQGPITLNQPMERLESMILDQQLRHADNPILGWNVANAVMQRSPTGLMYLFKGGDGDRFDGLAAVVDMVAAWQADFGTGPSVYETRGLISLG